MKERNKLLRKTVVILLIGFIIIVIISFFFKIGCVPYFGKIIAENKLNAYAKAQMQSETAIQVYYDWYNGRYIGSADFEQVLAYRLQNNSIYDGIKADQVNNELIASYKDIIGRFPKNHIFPQHIMIWSTINADDYNLQAERLYILELYNNNDLTETESEKMPAKIATDFIEYMGENYNITGIQFIYADINGMYDIEIRADSYKPLKYEQLLKATKKRTDKELPLSYYKWLEEKEVTYE
jgi:hypothetical protein